MDVPRSRASMRRAVEGEVLLETMAAGGAAEVLSLRCLSQNAKASFFLPA